MEFTKYIKRGMFGFLLLLVVLVAIFGLYLQFDFDPGQTAQDVITNPVKVAVTYDKGDYVEFYPSDGEIKAGVILYPGAKVNFECYAPLLEKMAENGYLAVAVKVPGNIALLDLHAADTVVERYPNVMHWYMMGHSLGAQAAGSYIRANSFYFDGLVMLGGYTTADIANPNITRDLRVICINGSNDKVLSWDKYESNKKNLPADLTEATIEGGNHMQFADTKAMKKDGQATISAEAQWDETVSILSAWLEEGIANCKDTAK